MASDGPIGWLMLLVGSIIAVLLVGLLFMGCDYVLGFNRDVRVTVVEKMYTPSKSGSGVATGVTSNGGVGTAVVSTYESEKFTLLVRDQSGEAFTHEVKATEYIKAKTGDEITITLRVGKFSQEEYR